MSRWVAAVLALGLLVAPLSAGPLDGLESDFEKAIGRLAPAVVVCLPAGIPLDRVPIAGSGVIVSRTGLVLSDGDVGVHHEGKPPRIVRSDDIEVRVPDPKGRGFRAYPGKVLHRSAELDTSVVRVAGLPGDVLAKHMQPGTSADVRVGDFAFVMGNSFNTALEGAPTLTAGIVGAIESFASPGAEGPHRALFTTAAVNPGVNGGPVADAEGLLIGTVSQVVPNEDPRQCLGSVVPIDRLRAFYADKDVGKELFPDRPPRGVRTKTASLLERVFHHTGRFVAARALVGLVVRRKGDAPLERVGPGPDAGTRIPGSTGPASGVLVDRERGWVATSLYNLANVEPLVHAEWTPPDTGKVRVGIDAIESVEVRLPGGQAVPGRLLGWSERAGLALVGVEPAALPASMAPLEPIDDEELLAAGRVVLSCGAPVGPGSEVDPLLAFGVLSKRHADDVDAPWRGMLQTDAGITDGNAGGAAVDLEGRLYGIATLWSPLLHGRNSGIGFIVPWSVVRAHLEPLSLGKRPAWLGISWQPSRDTQRPVVGQVVEGSPAAQGGLLAGDEILAVDGAPLADAATFANFAKSRWAGDRVVLGVRGADGVERRLEIVFGEPP